MPGRSRSEQDMRASGGGARSGEQGERKRKEERGAPHNPDGSTASAMRKSPPFGGNHAVTSGRAES